MGVLAGFWGAFPWKKFSVIMRPFSSFFCTLQGRCFVDRVYRVYRIQQQHQNFYEQPRSYVFDKWINVLLAAKTLSSTLQHTRWLIRDLSLSTSWWSNSHPSTLTDVISSHICVPAENEKRSTSVIWLRNLNRQNLKCICGRFSSATRVPKNNWFRNNWTNNAVAEGGMEGQ